MIKVNLTYKTWDIIYLELNSCFMPQIGSKWIIFHLSYWFQSI